MSAADTHDAASSRPRTGSIQAVARRRARARRRTRRLLLAALGALAVFVAVVAATVLRPDTPVTAVATVTGPAPVLVSAPGLLEAYPGAVSITVTSASASASASGARGRPVLVAVGRQVDVAGYVGAASVATVTGWSSPGHLAVRTRRGEPTLPNPAASDLWVATSTSTGTSTGTAHLTWRPRAGRWQLLVAREGTSAVEATLTLRWQEPTAPRWAGPLASVGLLAVVVAAVGAVLDRGPRGEAARRSPRARPGRA